MSTSNEELNKNLRAQWGAAKKLSETDEYTAMYKECVRNGLDVSKIGFTFCKMQMSALNLEGMPYIDAKTFNGWKHSGFKVKKGEKSKIYGIVWMAVKDKDSNGEDGDLKFMYPKVYHLFHNTQVEPLETKTPNE